MYMVFMYMVSHSKDVALRLIHLHSRCPHHTSSAAEHIHDSYTRTGREDSMCHLGNGLLQKTQTIYLQT